MKKSTPRSLKKKADILFSKIVRDFGRCEKCGRSKEQVQLHCAHIMSRRYLATRWDYNNAFCLCAACHRRFTDRPLDFAEFVKEKKGQLAYDLLRSKAKTMIKRLKLADYQQLVFSLEREWETE